MAVGNHGIQYRLPSFRTGPDLDDLLHAGRYAEFFDKPVPGRLRTVARQCGIQGKRTVGGSHTENVERRQRSERVAEDRLKLGDHLPEFLLIVAEAEIDVRLVEGEL